MFKIILFALLKVDKVCQIQMDIKRNISEFKRGIDNQKVTLIAVSKTKPEGDIVQAYEEGQRDFGENKVQELAGKHEALPDDIRWHMIGHLQRNKVKYIAPFVHLIHGVDSRRLLAAIDKEGRKCNRVIHCLLQMHIAQESTKFGLSKEELYEILDALSEYPNVQIRGLMGMATFTSDQNQIREEFAGLKSIFDEVTARNLPQWDTLSMGMSGDYKIAIEQGSTMIRVGSAIFGERNYG